ncbi:MAG: DUF3299 domain-containing protein [Bacteroidota bacterium]
MLRTTLFLALLFSLATITYAQNSVQWDKLEEVEYVKKGSTWAPKFSAAVTQMDGQKVTMKGFMLPLDQAEKQTRFILGPQPMAGCDFCLPGGALIEVQSDKGVTFTYEPVTITGVFVVAEDDPYGMFYRITGAVKG